MKTKIKLLFIIALTAAAAVFVWPGNVGNKILPWRLGLDLIGGSHLIYEVDMSGVSSADRDSVLAGLHDVMERRVNIFGISEPQVLTAKSGDSYRILIELAGVQNTQEAIAHIGKTAQLDFREVEEVKEAEQTIVWKPSELTGKYLKRAQVTLDSQIAQPEISIEFNSDGAKLFEEITGRNIGKPLAIFLDNELISSPVVRQKIIGGNAVISGQFSGDEAKALASLLNAGALPAPVSLVSQQVIGASLGENSLNSTMVAGLVGTIVVMLFMAFYYRKLGIFSALALAIYVILTLAVFKGITMTMTLAGIAGFVLSIGMAVDANVLIFERTKEELKKGISKLTAIEEGFQRAWPSIRDSNITTMISSVILYYFTSGFVKGFALSLLIGVVVSMFSAITVTRALLKTFVKN